MAIAEERRSHLPEQVHAASAEEGADGNLTEVGSRAHGEPSATHREAGHTALAAAGADGDVADAQTGVHLTQQTGGHLAGEG